MGSKSKKLAKKIKQAISKVLPKKKQKEHASLIEKYAKKVAKKLTAKPVQQENAASIQEELVEKNVAPTVWNGDESQEKLEEESK